MKKRVLHQGAAGDGDTAAPLRIWCVFAAQHASPLVEICPRCLTIQPVVTTGSRRLNDFSISAAVTGFTSSKNGGE